jgi:hypothetical protein
VPLEPHEHPPHLVGPAEFREGIDGRGTCASERSARGTPSAIRPKRAFTIAEIRSSWRLAFAVDW